MICIEPLIQGGRPFMKTVIYTFFLITMITISFASAGNIILYDGSMNTAPAQQDWVYLVNPLFLLLARGGYLGYNRTNICNRPCNLL